MDNGRQSKIISETPIAPPSSPPSEPQPGWQHFVPAGLLLLVSVAGIIAMIARPVPGLRQVAVVLPPWAGLPRAELLAARVGGRLVDAGGWSNVFIVAAERPDLAAALYRSGAWLVINPLGAHGCASTDQNIRGS